MKRQLIIFISFILFFCTIADASAAGTRSIIKIGSDVTIEEGVRVSRVVAIGGQVTVDGVVDDSIFALGGSVVLTSNAIVGGDITTIGGILVRGAGAEIQGNITEINSANFFEATTSVLNNEWQGWSWVFALISLIVFLCVLIVALLLVFLIPTPTGLVANAIREDTLRAAVSGLLILVLIVPLAVLLTISVVGIVLIPLEIVLVAGAALMGFIAVGKLVGTQVLAISRKHDQNIVRETFWGLVVLWLIGWIPYIGWMIKTLAIVLGLGGVLITRFGTIRK
jgi:hypothetical protein